MTITGGDMRQMIYYLMLLLLLLLMMANLLFVGNPHRIRLLGLR